MDWFEPAKNVWTYRDYRDVANSMAVAFTSLPRTVRGIAGQNPEFGWWGRGLSEDTRSLLERIVAKGPDAHTSAALLWYLRNRLFFQRGLDRDERVLLIRYEDLVTDPENERAQVTAFSGIPFTPRLRRGIHPQSIGRRPEPELEPEVREACQGLMAAFEESRTVAPAIGGPDGRRD